MAHSLQALIFDVDGTLADTERDAHRPAFNLAFREAGLDWDWDAATYGTLLRVAGGKERIAAYAGLRGVALAPQQVRAIHAAKTGRYRAIVEAGGLRLRPGVARLLHAAREAGVALAIATTTTEQNVLALLEATLGPGAPDWFACIGAGDVVARKKPAPDIYLHVLAALGLEAGACLAFEDSANGLRAAAGAGLATVVTPTAYTAGEDFGGALCVLSGLGEANAPCRSLAGRAPDGPCVGLDTLRAWHADLTAG